MWENLNLLTCIIPTVIAKAEAKETRRAMPSASFIKVEICSDPPIVLFSTWRFN